MSFNFFQFLLIQPYWCYLYATNTFQQFAVIRIGSLILLSFLLLAEENCRLINCKQKIKSLVCSFRSKYARLFVNSKGKRPETYMHFKWFWCRQGRHELFMCRSVNTLFCDLCIGAFNDHSIYFVSNKMFTDVLFYKNNMTFKEM